MTADRTKTARGQSGEPVRQVIASGAILSSLLLIISAAKGDHAEIASPHPAKTLASLRADGYEEVQTRLGTGTMFLRKPSTTYNVTYICEEGPIVARRNDEDILCSLTESPNSRDLPPWAPGQPLFFDPLHSKP